MLFAEISSFYLYKSYIHSYGEFSQKMQKRRHRCYVYFVFTKNGFIVKAAKIYLQLNAVSQLFRQLWFKNG